MKILITGSSGFVGSRISEELDKKGFKLLKLTRQKFSDSRSEFLYHDLAEPTSPDIEVLKDVRVVINCAGVISDEAMMEKVHVTGTSKLLDAIEKVAEREKVEIRWIQLSSVGAYGPETVRLARVVDSISAENPTGEYEITKTKADNLIHARVNRCKYLHAKIVRPTNIFGVGMANQSLEKLIKQIASKKFVYVGDRFSVLNYVSVDLIVEVVVDLVKYEFRGISTVIIATDCTIGELVDLVVKSYGNESGRFLSIPPVILLVVAYIGSKFFRNFPMSISRVKALNNRTVYVPSLAISGYVHSGVTEELKKYIQHLNKDT